MEDRVPSNIITSPTGTSSALIVEDNSPLKQESSTIFNFHETVQSTPIDPAISHHNFAWCWALHDFVNLQMEPTTIQRPDHRQQPFFHSIPVIERMCFNKQ
ncbi:hypothetical protein PMAYCL1PPCAC_28421 [Pristionchus mayeri]|uniref:Uncharacterized protein n=1 Tax=Pristionchus mayeri TaxID=1317129 RepID=A0AAN5D8A5_9BILA|nr:hypothetical protein PMAYCL1PPCAC_28420 [Pristionchus mayeri]GMR58226.1 hypothetical protein PMAYCL1PPCAC_28421 [Pristionchus mayeri]